jgi:hypothetical protein
MSSAQSSELSTFLSERGQLGVQWSTQDAYGAPIELEAEVRLANKNLEAQKEAEIKSALVSNTEAPFAFDNIGFDVEYTKKNIISVIEDVPGVLNAKINRFHKIPQSLVINGTEGDAVTAGSDSAFADISLGTEAEDGYFSFVADSTSTAEAHFFRPFKTDTIGPTWVRSSETNWLEEEYDFAEGSELDDSDGPWVKTVGGKLSFKQLSAVWENDQFNGDTYMDKYLLRVQWVDDSGVTRTSYYHIADTTLPHTIVTLEDSDSPISGTAITTLANSSYSKVNVQVIKDQTNGTTNTMLTSTGSSFTINYNDKNTLYLSASPADSVPINQYSYVHFNETELDTSTDGWISLAKALKARIHLSEPFSVGDIVSIYTTPLVANTLKYKHTKEVFTLAKSNITIRFV